MSPSAPLRAQAVRMLILCTALWALSFPATRTIALLQQQTLPEASTWFISSLCVVARFGLAAAGMVWLARRTLGQISRRECEQGIGLGLFGGLGILLQVDGLSYTSASTSAFLTQVYCLLIPVWVAAVQRRWPSAKVFLSCGLVFVGVSVLAGVDWRDFRLGRGEWETLAASALFTGQILLLERPAYAGNDVRRFSLVMFTVIALVSLPVCVLMTPQWSDWVKAYASPAALGCLAILIFPCTFGAYLLMNRWQKRVTATEAGLIYCLEPVFTSAFALCLPLWLGRWAGVDYPNETLTRNLLIGGAFITAANVLIQLRFGGGAVREEPPPLPVGEPR